MRRRNYLLAVVLVIAVLVSMVGVAVLGNDFRFSARAVVIPGPAGNLNGVVTLPQGGEPKGVVLMVHGDGPIDATQSGLYHPWFEAAADAGYATLSWSKPGVGGSVGNWLSQSMEDRAAEVAAVLEWAKGSDDVPTGSMVLWGASQAGWVLPKVVRERADIDGVVAVGPAINWLRQGRFHLLAQLDHDRADAVERARAVAVSDRTRELLRQGASYAQYRAVVAEDPMSEDRWAFVLRNVEADAEADLHAAATREIPVHLMVGTQDRNVDIAETADVYRTAFGPQLSITRLDGAHSLARTVMEDNEVVGFATAIIWPRALLAEGAMADFRAFLAALR